MKILRNFEHRFHLLKMTYFNKISYYCVNHKILLKIIKIPLKIIKISLKNKKMNVFIEIESYTF